MKRTILAFAALALLITGLAYARVGRIVDLALDSSTDNVSRRYVEHADYFYIYPWVADVEVIIYPQYSSDQDTLTFRAGIPRTLEIKHDGFDLIRTTATPVDIQAW
jgi:hypothetical protein